MKRKKFKSKKNFKEPVLPSQYILNSFFLNILHFSIQIIHIFTIILHSVKKYCIFTFKIWFWPRFSEVPSWLHTKKIIKQFGAYIYFRSTTTTHTFLLLFLLYLCCITLFMLQTFKESISLLHLYKAPKNIPGKGKADVSPN